MQDYDEIRRRYNAGESQRQIARALGVSMPAKAKGISPSV